MADETDETDETDEDLDWTDAKLVNEFNSLRESQAMLDDVGELSIRVSAYTSAISIEYEAASGSHKTLSPTLVDMLAGVLQDQRHELLCALRAANTKKRKVVAQQMRYTAARLANETRQQSLQLVFDQDDKWESTSLRYARELVDAFGEDAVMWVTTSDQFGTIARPLPEDEEHARTGVCQTQRKTRRAYNVLLQCRADKATESKADEIPF